MRTRAQPLDGIEMAKPQWYLVGVKGEEKRRRCCTEMQDKQEVIEQFYTFSREMSHSRGNSEILVV